jgi:nucleoside-diphosphate-sugar epimerase
MKYREEENSLSKVENSQKIKILITGGSGFIGSRLLRNLIRKKNLMENPYLIRCLARNR